MEAGRVCWEGYHSAEGPRHPGQHHHRIPDRQRGADVERRGVAQLGLQLSTPGSKFIVINLTRQAFGLLPALQDLFFSRFNSDSVNR